MLGAFQVLVLNNLNPIAVWVINEGNSPHPTVSQTLLPVNIQGLEAVASRMQIVDRNT